MKRLTCLLVSLAVVLAVHAQTPPPARDVKISFIPPPTEGTISLGIYDAKGTLVRVLHRETEVDELEAGNDALITHWDGKNDAGEPLPSGKYHARGYAVDADIEGIGYFFNDWVTDEDSLRIARITAIEIENGVPLLSVKLADGRGISLLCDVNANIMNTGDERPRRDTCDDALSCATGKDNTRWTIARTGSDATQVKQFSSNGELLRHLTINPQDPQPQQIAASKDSDTILLLEENAAMQRLRSLTLVTTNEGNSDWKIDFEKKIVAHQNFNVEIGKPVTSGGKTPTDRVSVKLQPNELQNKNRVTLEIVVGYDADGSFLKTADGLPLQSISETQHLTRIVLAPQGEKNRVDIFQDDGAVVEQFRASDLDQMAAFDGGEFDLK
ncbi:MAG: FlgD immunoglobulin-like domain containing protein [Chthoniobacterales bacterium]